MTLSGAILAATGGPTVEDGLMACYGGSGSLHDRGRAWLEARTVAPAESTNEEPWAEFLRTSGYRYVVQTPTP